MENIQINGQKIWGPPRDWTGPPPPHGTEIYIKNLPDDVLEMELFHIFSKIGRVYEVRLPVHWSGINRGYAFVRYTKISEADEAIKRFDGFEIRNGRSVKIERSVDNTRLFLSCVPNDKTSDEIKRDLQTVVENVERVYVYPTLENPAVYRGYAFVEFKSHRDAAIAKRILTPDVCFGLFEKKCVAAWANPLPFLNENVLKTINILFMRNVPKEYKSITVKKAIENLLGDNTIQKVKRLNDFAFLTFKNHETAKEALNAIKNYPGLLGSNKIQVEWAVPRELINANNNCLEEYENRKLNDATRQNSHIPSHVTNSTNQHDMFEAVENYSRLDDQYLIDTQSHRTPSEDLLSPRETKFQRHWRNSRMGLYNTAKEHSDTECLQMKGSYNWEAVTPFAFDAECSKMNGNVSSNTFRDVMSSSIPISPMGGSDGTWNLTPNSDIELEEPFRSPQNKHWLGSLMHSPTTSSPTLTTSPRNSDAGWIIDEQLYGSFHRSSNYKLQLGMEKLTINNIHDSLENVRSRDVNIFSGLSNHLPTPFNEDNFT